ncbi:hypothetical protein AVEN_173535-1, partial [Araneus ventricosus]
GQKFSRWYGVHNPRPPTHPRGLESTGMDGSWYGAEVSREGASSGVVLLV